MYRRFFDCFSVICNKTFYKVYTLFSHTHLTTLSQLLAVGGVTVTMALSCIICDIKRDIGRKSWFISYPLHSAPPLGGSPSEYRHPVWCGKTRMVEACRRWNIFEDMCNRLEWIPACGRRTERRTSKETDGRCDGMVRAIHTRRAVKVISVMFAVTGIFLSPYIIVVKFLWKFLTLIQ